MVRSQGSRPHDLTCVPKRHWVVKGLAQNCVYITQTLQAPLFNPVVPSYRSLCVESPFLGIVRHSPFHTWIFAKAIIRANIVFVGAREQEKIHKDGADSWTQEKCRAWSEKCRVWSERCRDSVASGTITLFPTQGPHGFPPSDRPSLFLTPSPSDHTTQSNRSARF